MRSLVTFTSDDFNCTEQREYFINPNCFGDDVCRYLIEEIRKTGVDVDEEPQQEDFGWYFCYRLPVGRYCFVISCRDPDETNEALWMGWVERHCGFIGSLLGQRQKDISPHAVETIYRVLKKSDKIVGMLWHDHQKFKDGFEQSGRESPEE